MVNMFASAATATAAILLLASANAHPTVKQLHQPRQASTVVSTTQCQRYTVANGDTCDKVSKAHNISLQEFLDANPQVDDHCQLLILGEPVCIPANAAVVKLKGQANAAVAGLSVDTSNLANITISKPGATSAEGWTLKKVYEGENFFDGWDFYGDYPGDGKDPTNGQVTYANKANAGDLISSSAAGAVLKMEQGANKWMRKSIRLQSQLTMDTGSLVIFDADHAPAGDGLWPAFWTVGQNWPNNGEIDIMEWTNNAMLSQTSFHTGSGCWMDGTPFSGQLTGGANCASAETANGGCGILNAGLAGKAFNDAKGGVYAMVWTDNGIKTYFFRRDQIPDDITARTPKPTTWGQPVGFLPSNKCNPSTFFKKHSIVINTTTCGDWAGNAFPGGLGACQAYMQGNPDLSEAYWSIRSVQVYNQ